MGPEQANKKSTKCIFIGYSIYRKAYRLWNPETNILHESRDVIFMERDFDNRIDAAKSIQRECNTEEIPVFEEETSDEEILEKEKVANEDQTNDNNDYDDREAQDENRQLPRRKNMLENQQKGLVSLLEIGGKI